MTTPRPRSRQPKQLDAGILQAEITSFAVRLAAEGKAARTIRTYTEAVRWLPPPACPGTPTGPAGSKSAAATSSGGWRGVSDLFICTYCKLGA
jgi:hypothetical protein